MSGNDLQDVPPLLHQLARQLGTVVKNRRLDIPEKYGRGYCTGYLFSEYMRLLISSYELNEEIDVPNREIDTSRRMIFFKFQNIFRDISPLQADKRAESAPSVLIATSRLNTDEIIAVHTNRSTINIEIDASYLGSLFPITGRSPVLESLLQNKQPLLFEQLVYPAMQKIVDEIVTEQVDERFELFFRRIKSEELICRLLMELEKRDGSPLYALNTRDIGAVYMVREQMLKYPEVPPVIAELAAAAHMSPSKLKRLFRQIFGSSIFSYYQEFRMREAARLLRQELYSVSDAGYQLGFTNLSHFARLFEKHMGMKPKRYSLMLAHLPETQSEADKQT